MRIERLQQEFDLDIRWTVFPLHPETPETGRDLDELFAGRVDIPQMMARLQSVAKDLGLPFAERTRTFNSRKAQELGKWAEQRGQGDAFRNAVYEAYFSDGRNIGQNRELLAICSNLDLPTDEAQHVLDGHDFAAVVDHDWERARQLGIQSVPSHVFENRVLVGFQDYSAFRRLIESC